MRFTLGNWVRKRSVHDAMLSVESARLLDMRMFKELFFDAEISTEKILILNKSLIAIKIG